MQWHVEPWLAELRLYATDHKWQLTASNKYLLVVNLSDQRSIFAGGEVQLQALPELDIIKQSTKLLQGSDVPSLHVACMHNFMSIAQARECWKRAKKGLEVLWQMEKKEHKYKTNNDAILEKQQLSWYCSPPSEGHDVPFKCSKPVIEKSKHVDRQAEANRDNEPKMINALGDTWVHFSQGINCCCWPASWQAPFAPPKLTRSFFYWRLQSWSPCVGTSQHRLMWPDLHVIRSQCFLANYVHLSSQKWTTISNVCGMTARQCVSHWVWPLQHDPSLPRRIVCLFQTVQKW